MTERRNDAHPGHHNALIVGHVRLRELPAG